MSLACSFCKPSNPTPLLKNQSELTPLPSISLSFLGLLIYASVVYHQYRKGRLGSGSKSNGKYVSANNPEVHNLVSNPAHPGQTAYPQQQGYAHEYPQTAYYDPSAVANAQQYGGQGYEPYRNTGHAQV